MGQLKRQLRWIGHAQFWATVAAVACTGATAYIAYRPQRSMLIDLRQKKVEVDTQLRAGLTHTSILPAVAADVDRLRSELDRSKTLPHQKELPQFIGNIAQLAGQCQLSKFDLKPGAPAHDDQFNLLPMTMNFEGDFMNVFSFLRKTEDLQQLTRVRNLDVEHKDKAGQVKVQLTLLIYFDTE